MLSSNTFSVISIASPGAFLCPPSRVRPKNPEPRPLGLQVQCHASAATGNRGIRLRYRYRGIQTRRGEHAGRELTGTGVGCKWHSTRVALQWRTRLPSESWRMKTTMPSWAFPVVAYHRATCEHTLLARMQTHVCRRTHRGARGPVESNHAEPHTSGDPLVLMKHLWPRRGRARGGAAPGPGTGPEGGQLRPSPSWTSWGAAPSGCWGAHRRRRW